MLRQRLITALTVFPILVAAVWFDRPLPWFTVLVAGWGLMAVFEFYRVAAVPRALAGLGLVLSLLFIVSPHFDYDFFLPSLLTLAVVLPLVSLLALRHKEGAFAGWAWMAAGILYLGWMLSHLIALRGMDAGRDWVFLALFVTFGSDSAAFFIGKRWGRRRLAPYISPAKTWEGAAAGAVGGIGASLVLTGLLSLPLTIGQAALLGLLTSVFGQLGDLVESLFKRNMGVKDSGRSIPGHGGFLDRIDSVVFAGVVVYYYLIWVIR
ncbi:MAG: phosphatidate cytidylyltransferase [Chloroflexi bacterium]|nr:phosphatidate cytidylyltransferase [Chloroflexota bacterium]